MIIGVNNKKNVLVYDNKGVVDGGLGVEKYERMKTCEAIRNKIKYAIDDLDNVTDSFFVKAKDYIENGIIINGTPFGSEGFSEYEKKLNDLKNELSVLDGLVKTISIE